MSIENHLKEIKRRVDEACGRSGRESSSVQLVAVSKTQPVTHIQEAFQCNQKLFGENYVQEAIPKIEQLRNVPIQWHFIGPLQSNKVRKMIGLFELVHSVDRLSLMKEISRQCELNRCEQKILLQVNVSGETSKSGLNLKEVESLLAEGLKLPRIKICGLMTMPPLSQTPEQNRPLFAQLKQLLVDLKGQFFKNNNDQFFHLSMGTSQDFEVAIEEGATLIRLGTQVFGSREDVV